MYPEWNRSGYCAKDSWCNLWYKPWQTLHSAIHLSNLCPCSKVPFYPRNRCRNDSEKKNELVYIFSFVQDNTMRHEPDWKLIWSISALPTSSLVYDRAIHLIGCLQMAEWITNIIKSYLPVIILWCTNHWLEHIVTILNPSWWIQFIGGGIILKREWM